MSIADLIAASGIEYESAEVHNNLGLSYFEKALYK